MVRAIASPLCSWRKLRFTDLGPSLWRKRNAEQQGGACKSKNQQRISFDIVAIHGAIDHLMR
jgi:hypothetical protein